MKKNQPFSIKARLKSFVFAINGLKEVLKTEHNFWVHILATIMVTILGFIYSISSIEWMFLLSAIFSVIVSEGLNSSIEYLADVLHPEQNIGVGKAKDIASGAVLLSSIYSVLIFCFVFIPKWV